VPECVYHTLMSENNGRRDVRRFFSLLILSFKLILYRFTVL
jgi:hypothetical protein